MSCGNPHEMPCIEVRSMMALYIDNELEHVEIIRITGHLTECPPCDELFVAERSFRALVQRSCQCGPAPEELRVSITAKIQQLRIEPRTE